ncbi:hypothetical protein RQ831_05470 [Roseomonas gilardii]|uniref:Uncharacterized protein n=1 Tax=Roseomonas gilardii TaxID=257708 RepID=A0ABU3MCI5_9PROT|nr:hypothetical protein [Roseomonas gilardii]MDT8330495.1 hypothetical protein [Roseomonas gilardii]
MIAPTYAERALAYVATGALPPLPTLEDGVRGCAIWVGLLVVLMTKVRA